MENAHPRETVSNQNSPFDAETVLVVTTPAVETVKAFNATLNETVQACQKECAGFWRTRMTENLALSSRLMACRSLPEIQQAYVDYWRHTAEQYAKEYSQMFHILHHTPHEAGSDAAASTAKNTGASKH